MAISCIFNHFTHLNWAAEEEDSTNKSPQMPVEISFNNIVLKFMPTEYLASHYVFKVVGLIGHI
jgi:hypothetical protein